MARAGHLRVPREDARAAVKTIALAGQIVHDEGIALLIFPEGGRSRTGAMRDFKEGAALIAIKAGVPLVPIALKGTREILPFGSGIVRSGNVSMRIGDPIPTAGATSRDRAQLTEEVRHRIVAMLEEHPIPA